MAYGFGRLDPFGHLAARTLVQSWLGAPARSYARRPATVVDALDRCVRFFGRLWQNGDDGGNAGGRNVGDLRRSAFDDASGRF